uniref:BZIP domain-containing protein n=1 Tax=Strigamia maritima TaxID=126957 RepID=T1J1U0_STRMM
MAFLSIRGAEEALSLWDPMEDLQTAAECVDFDFLSNDWVNTDEGHKLIDDNNSKFKFDDDENLLLDEGSELFNWMETKFDFGTLEDINLLIQEDEDVKMDEPDVGSKRSSCGASPLSTSFEAGESIVEEEVELERVVCETRAKPYERPKRSTTSKTEVRKSRKRSQNRTAATRYRMKKREEAEVLSAEEERLKETNGELNKRVDDLSSEIKYLKGLLKEFVRAKRR